MPDDTPMQPKVFISHTSSDHAFVYRLAADLARDGCDVWLDDVKLHIGDSLPEEIQHAIHEAHFLVAVLSAQSVTRPWVKEELNTALARTVDSQERFILPCLVEDCDLPEFLTHRLYADFRNWQTPQAYDAAYRRLLSAIIPEGPLPLYVQVELSRLAHPNDSQRAGAALALGMTGSERVVPALIEALRDAHPDVRKAAAKGLAAIPTTDSVRAIAEAYQDADRSVRHVVGWVLGLISQGDLRLVARPSQPPDDQVRRAAREALDQISHEEAQTDDE